LFISYHRANVVWELEPTQIFARLFVKILHLFCTVCCFLFSKVYNVCRNVALIDETSGSLWEYALSWLQSILIVDVKYKCLEAISHYDTTKQTDSRPDSFQLLSSAKFAMASDHNIFSALETAVRLLGQLRGQSRVVANDWLVDARHYLEAKQTARTLLAYVAARDISTFQKRL
uniref:MICOS complex subunit MIC60 n=1 Tax=Schistosoma curassoni TaxID=6186 RepID=A0A183JI23_9TREM